MRERSRHGYYQLIPRLEQIGQAQVTQKIRTRKGDIEVEPDFDQQINAIDKLGKYGLPQQHEVKHAGVLVLKAVRE